MELEGGQREYLARIEKKKENKKLDRTIKTFVSFL